jgi:hypothetical protein
VSRWQAHGPDRLHRACAACGGVHAGGELCPTCLARDAEAALTGAPTGDARSADPAALAVGATAIELIPAAPVFQPGTAHADRERSTASEVIPIREAVVTRHGVARTLAIPERPGAWIAHAWIARDMNWRRTACHAACWGLGGALAAIVAAACAVGSVVTIGGLAIPCVYLVVGAGAAAGVSAAICSDACDQVIADNPRAAAEADPAAPAVADESGRALTSETAEDVAEAA